MTWKRRLENGAVVFVAQTSEEPVQRMLPLGKLGTKQTGKSFAKMAGKGLRPEGPTRYLQRLIDKGSELQNVLSREGFTKQE